MMFDTLVCAESDQVDPDDEHLDADLDTSTLFKSTNSSVDMTTDLLIEYLTPYRQFQEGIDSATDPDLSWDEGDLPNNRLIQVWSFNDFMDQYNQIYAWLNNIQVQYHDGKKKEGSSPRVEGYLKELEKDIHKRERFLRESGRMVGVYPELEGEVVWRMEHLMAKWDMLAGLRNKARTNKTDLPDVYSDIELEVRCLRKWLREMEARIDPLQFSRAQQWTTRDREKKMMEYQVLQTDIESHGRIVKLVLSLCEDLSQNPGQYDLPHALKVAKALERRWHQIWLRSLEWQCLLEQWLQHPSVADTQAIPSPGLLSASSGLNTSGVGVLADTDEEEPVNKVRRLTENVDCGRWCEDGGQGQGRDAGGGGGIPRLVDLFASPTFSPAATLLRVKKRKRMLAASSDTDLPKEDRKISPRARRRLTSHEPDTDSFQSEEEGPNARKSKFLSGIPWLFSGNHEIKGKLANYASSQSDEDVGGEKNGHEEAMNTSEDGTNSDETPRLHLDLENSGTILERTGSIETPRTVVEGPTSNLLNMLAKMEAEEFKQMKKRTDGGRPAPITFCESSEDDFNLCNDANDSQGWINDLEDWTTMTGYRLSKSGQHSLEYEVKYNQTSLPQAGRTMGSRSGSKLDLSFESPRLGLDNRAESACQLESVRTAHQEHSHDLTVSPFSNRSLDTPSFALSTTLDDIIRVTPPAALEGMDVCDGREEEEKIELEKEEVCGVSAELASLDSLEITSSSPASFVKFKGLKNDSLEDVSSILGSKSSMLSSQGISLESLSSEELADALRLETLSSPCNLDNLDMSQSCKQTEHIQPNSARNLTQAEEAKPTQTSSQRSLGGKGKKKKRKRTNLSCLDDSQSDVEMESYCNHLMDSRDQLFSLATSDKTGDYETITEACEKNIQFLKDILSSWKQENSFISKKKSREARILLSDWTGLLETVKSRVHMKSAVDRLLARTDSVRDRLMSLQPGESDDQTFLSNLVAGQVIRHQDSADIFTNQDYLTVSLYKYKDEMITLDQCKSDLADLNLQLHNVKIRLESSTSVHHSYPGREAARKELISSTKIEDSEFIIENLKMDEAIKKDIEVAQEKISGVYVLWEKCHHSTTSKVSRAEETLEKFKQFERELMTLKKGLRKDALRYRGRKSALREVSCDSGISDASTDNDFPLREQQLERLRHLAANLETSLHPDTSITNVISKTIESTSTQLKDLKLSFQRLKTSKAKMKKVGSHLSQAAASRRAGAAASSSSCGGGGVSSRRRRVCKAAMLLNILLMALMLLAALIHPRCCDAPGIISMLPQLKYTNGPPPI